MRIINCTHDHHAREILDILNEAIENSTAIYDYRPRAAESMAGWFDAKEKGRFPVIGAVGPDGELLGFASYGTFRNWPAYKYSVEHSVYVHHAHRGRGIGLTLMERLIAIAEERQCHTMIGGIDIMNKSSVALHMKLGFHHAGTIEHAAFKFGGWLDLGFYQRLLATPVNPVDG
jgi:L-amino acid N-acyltransferase